LRHHPGRLTVDADIHLLAGELVALVGVALFVKVPEEVVFVGVVGLSHDRDTIIPDLVERYHLCPASPHKVLIERARRALGLRVSVGRHHPVENLPRRQGQMVTVLLKNLLDLKHQPRGLLVRPPGRVAFRALVGVFTASREIL
jgi:hypothetical protein